MDIGEDSDVEELVNPELCIPSHTQETEAEPEVAIQDDKAEAEAEVVMVQVSEDDV